MSSATLTSSEVKQASPKTIKFLILRELWEYKNLYFLVPISIGIALFFLYSYSSIRQLSQVESLQVVQLLVNGNIFQTILLTLTWLVSIIGFYYLMSSLHSDRTDRSILFWKSLPISDWQMVFSKMCFPLFFGPALAIALSFIVYVATCLVVSIYASVHGQSAFSELFFQSTIWQDPIRAFTLLPVYMLWALPTVGWIMFISAWTKSRVFPWVIGVPVLIELIAVFANVHFRYALDMLSFSNNVFLRIIGGLFPGMWVLPNSVEQTMNNQHNLFLLADIYQQGLQELVSPRLWLGSLAGCILIVFAIRQRRYADVI